MSAESQATVAEQEYLETIFWLYEAGLPMTGANIARAMQLSAPTVHEMIGRLEADGYVTRAADKSLTFTESGQEHAAGIVRRHRLIERFLTDVFDIPWDQVHEEAERLEHWMSPMVEERMLRAIGDSKTCPHGHPIFEGEREDVGHVGDRVHRQLLEHGRRQVVQVRLVALRDDHVGQAGPVRGEQLLLHPADGQHPTLQGHLAGHTDLGPYRPSGGQ